MTYSFYKNKRPADSIADLKNTKFYFDSALNYAAKSDNGIATYINWGNLDVKPAKHGKPGAWIIEIHPVPHINLHACKMSNTQTTCSVKFPLSTDVSALNSQSFNLGGDKGWHNRTLALPEAGEWRIMSHIRYYVNDSNTWTRWDIGMTKKIVAVAPASPNAGEK